MMMNFYILNYQVKKDLSSKTIVKLKKNESLKNIIKNHLSLLKNSFELLLPDNTSSSIPCSSEGSVSIKLFTKFII